MEAMTDITVSDWTRFITAQLSQESKLQALAHMDDGVRAQVLKKLGMVSAQDVFEKTKVVLFAD